MGISWEVVQIAMVMVGVCGDKPCLRWLIFCIHSCLLKNESAFTDQFLWCVEALITFLFIVVSSVSPWCMLSFEKRKVLDYHWGLLQYFRNQWDVEMVRRLEHPQGDEISKNMIQIKEKMRQKLFFDLCSA